MESKIEWYATVKKSSHVRISYQLASLVFTFSVSFSKCLYHFMHVPSISKEMKHSHFSLSVLSEIATKLLVRDNTYHCKTRAYITWFKSQRCSHAIHIWINHICLLDNVVNLLEYMYWITGNKKEIE